MGLKPDVSLLKVFGCGVYMYLPEEKWPNKLAPWSELMTYLGVVAGIKGYHFMRPLGAIFMGATATFDEKLFPYCKTASTPDHTVLGRQPNLMEQTVTEMMTTLRATAPSHHCHHAMRTRKVSHNCMMMLIVLLLHCPR
jgi:hypothetical protein